MTKPEPKVPECKIVDSWAMIAWIGDEPGAAAMQEFVERAESGGLRLFMSVVNLGETFYILAKRRSLAVAEQFLDLFRPFPLRLTCLIGKE